MLRRLLINQGVLLKTCNTPVLCQVRRASNFHSNTEEERDKYTKFVKSYDEWKYVEHLFPPITVPDAPTDHTVEYPSGWKPPNPDVNLPYHITRTKNHMLPIYYVSILRGTLVHTRIRYVEGNLWILEKEIGNYLKKKYPWKTIITNSHEPCRYVQVRGDYVEDIQEWAYAQGF